MTIPPVVTTKAKIRRQIAAAHASGESTGVVMTMGALHGGHLSLVQQCCERVDRCYVTIFVNPTQFLPGEDFANYPRRLEADLELIGGKNVAAVFAPEPDEMYDHDFSTFIEPPSVATPLEGICRPGHFRGVCTVVFKLLQAVPARLALFGQKDYQQYLVLKQMARDLDLSVTVDVCPTVRESDGLAISSRNQYLDSQQRVQALSISRGLRAAEKKFQAGARDAITLLATIQQEVTTAGISQIDYVALADVDTLAELSIVEDRAVALVAARVGSTRLIDNLLLTRSVP